MINAPAQVAPRRPEGLQMTYFARLSIRKHCTVTSCSHSALEITAQACFGPTECSKSSAALANTALALFFRSLRLKSFCGRAQHPLGDQITARRCFETVPRPKSPLEQDSTQGAKKQTSTRRYKQPINQGTKERHDSTNKQSDTQTIEQTHTHTQKQTY